MVVHRVTQATQRRLCEVSPALDLVLTRTLNDIGSMELEDPVGGSDQVRVRLNPQRLAGRGDYSRNLSGMHKIGLLDLSLQTLWEVYRGSSYLARQ